MRLNDIAPPLDPELTKEMFECLNEMPKDQRSDFVGAGIGLMNYLKEKHPEVSPIHVTLSSFTLRIEAFRKLRRHPEYKVWCLKVGEGNDEPDLINEVIIDTVAVHPLVERGNHPA